MPLLLHHLCMMRWSLSVYDVIMMMMTIIIICVRCYDYHHLCTMRPSSSLPWTGDWLSWTRNIWVADFEYKALNTFFGAQQRSSLLDIIHRTKPNHLIPYPTPRIRDFFCCSSPCYGVSPRYGVSLRNTPPVAFSGGLNGPNISPCPEYATTHINLILKPCFILLRRWFSTIREPVAGFRH